MSETKLPAKQKARPSRLVKTFGRKVEDMTPAERATAITGYDLRTRIEAMIAGVTGKKIKTTFHGTGACTGEDIMILPSIPQTYLFLRHDAMTLLGYAAHEISHQLETDFEMIQNIFKDINKPTKEEIQIKEWWNAIEDYRIEKLTRRQFPGFPIFIGATRHYTADRFVIAAKEGLYTPEELSNPYRIGAVGLTWVGAILNGYPTKSHDEALSLLGHDLESWLRGLAPRLQAVESKDDALVLAKELLDELKQDQEEQEDEQQDSSDSTSDSQDDDDKQSQPSQGNQQGNSQNKTPPAEEGDEDQDKADQGESESRDSEDGAESDEGKDGSPDGKEKGDSSEQDGSESEGKEEGEEEAEGSGKEEDDSSSSGSDSEETENDESSSEQDDQSEDGQDQKDDNSQPSSEEDQGQSDCSGTNADANTDSKNGSDDASCNSQSQGSKTSGDKQEEDQQSEDGSGEQESSDSDDTDCDEGAAQSKDRRNQEKSAGKQAPAPRVGRGDAEAEPEESDLSIEEILEELSKIAQQIDRCQVDIDEDLCKGDTQVIQRSQKKYAMVKRTIGSPAARTAGIMRRLLLSQKRTNVRRNLEQGRLDLKRLVPIANGSPNVYYDKSTKKDVNSAVSILLDNSGSMANEPLVVCQKAAIVLDSAIQGTDTDLEILGFTGEPNRPQIYQYRRFGQKGIAAAASLGAMDEVSLGGTPVAVPILESHKRLMAHKAPRKIMIIISDGAAADPQRAKEAHDIAVFTGSLVFGIGIGQAATPMGNWCDNYHIIQSINDLPNALASIVQNALQQNRKRAA